MKRARAARHQGERTEGGVTRIGDIVERLEPAVVVVELGGNDGLQAQPIALLRENLGRMIHIVTEAGARVVLAGERAWLERQIPAAPSVSPVSAIRRA